MTFYATGPGVMVAMNASRDSFLELKVSYVDSGQMDYLTRNSASYSELGDLLLTLKQSGFNMIQPFLAVKYFFIFYCPDKQTNS
ncbi:MAG: hypothetical protein WD398_03720 [Cyclobacteriaceae bacterium]